MYNLTPAVKKILIVNVSIFILNFILNLNLIQTFGLRDFHSYCFRPYQLITHLFVHAGFLHLFSNMITLCTFGPTLESSLKSKKFYILYFVCGIGASCFYLMFRYVSNIGLHSFYLQYLNNPSPEFFADYLRNKSINLYNSYYGFIYDFLNDATNTEYIEKSIAIIKHICGLKFDIPMVGASGAIFGILAAYAFLFPESTICFSILPIEIQAKYFVFYYGLYELYASIRMNPGDNVAHLAHLGGILISYLYLKLFYKKKSY